MNRSDADGILVSRVRTRQIPPRVLVALRDECRASADDDSRERYLEWRERDPQETTR